MYKLTPAGIKTCERFIAECKAKRKEILDAGKDTADDTNIPTLEVIESDINAFGVDEEGDYFNGWGVTDNYNSDYPLGLTLGIDFIDDKTNTSDRKITKEMIQNGFDAGIISIEDSFEGCISLCCRIWDNAFYFAGKEGNLTVEEYFKIHTMNDVIDTLYDILKDVTSAEEHGLDEGEWMVYDSILREYYEKEIRDYRDEKALWYKFYMTFNDDNMRHADNSFQTNQLVDIYSAKLHQKNVEWFVAVMEHGFTPEEICKYIPEAESIQQEAIIQYNEKAEYEER